MGAFERVKTAAYNTLVGSTWVKLEENRIPFSILPLLQTIEEGTLEGYHKRMVKNKEELNKILDRWDIRCVIQLIDILPNKKSGVAGWIRRKEFVIDYNGKGELDLVRTS